MGGFGEDGVGGGLAEVGGEVAAEAFDGVGAEEGGEAQGALGVLHGFEGGGFDGDAGEVDVGDLVGDGEVGAFGDFGGLCRPEVGGFLGDEHLAEAGLLQGGVVVMAGAELVADGVDEGFEGAEGDGHGAPGAGAEVGFTEVVAGVAEDGAGRERGAVERYGAVGGGAHALEARA